MSERIFNPPVGRNLPFIENVINMGKQAAPSDTLGEWTFGEWTFGECY
jgi:hypothetical protein